MSKFIYGQGWVQGYRAPEGEVVDGGGGDKTNEVVNEVVVEDPEKTDETIVEGEPPATKEEPKATPVTTESLDAAIKDGLAKKAEPAKDAATIAAEKATSDLAAKVAAAGKHANGTPKMNEKGETLDDKGVVAKPVEPKAKTAAELALKPEELKALGQKTGARFTELLGTLKKSEATVADLSARNERLTSAHTNLSEVLRETRTTQEAFLAYLEFNELVTSKDPKKLEQALKIVNDQRGEIAKMLGVELEGVDLLDEFPDLKKEVEDEQISRARALEIAGQRRSQADRQRGDQRQQDEGRRQAAEQKGVDAGLKAIDGLQAELARGDIDYKAKEAKLIEKVADVIKNYRPDQWAPTLKLLYDGIVIEKAAPVIRTTTPLRPSGAKPGAPAPDSMKAAIDAGLGYSKA